MNKILIIFLLAFFISLITAETVHQTEIQFSLLNNTNVVINELPYDFSRATKTAITFTVSTPYKVLLCAQENSILKSDLSSSCQNLITLTPSVSTPEEILLLGADAKIATNTLSLRLSPTYFFSAQWAGGQELIFNDYTRLNITVTYTECASETDIGETCKPAQQFNEISANFTYKPSSVSNYYFDLSTPEPKVSSSVVFTLFDLTNSDSSSKLSYFVRYDNLPYDREDAKSQGDQNLTATLNVPKNGRYYVNVTGPDDGDDIKFSLFATVLRCDNATLWGPDCQSTIYEVNTTTNGEPQQQEVYYLYKGSNLIVGAGLKDEDGKAPNLYVQIGSPASTTSNIAFARDGDPVNFINAESNDPQFFGAPMEDTKWYVFVDRSNDDDDDFYIWFGTECLRNCSGQGTCSYTTGVCECSDGYRNYLCSDEGLETVWIVLIVIACVFVLAIAIGVPVACYIKNRKRARYERV